MHDLFILSTMLKNKILLKKYFKKWNGIEYKWLLSTRCLPPSIQNTLLKKRSFTTSSVVNLMSYLRA